MAFEKTPKDSSDSSLMIEMGLFAIVLMTFVLFGIETGARVLGGVMISSALWKQLKGRIPYGWEGQAPSGYLSGGIATILNLAMALFGLAILIWPEVAMAVLGWSGI